MQHGQGEPLERLLMKAVHMCLSSQTAEMRWLTGGLVGCWLLTRRSLQSAWLGFKGQHVSEGTGVGETGGHQGLVECTAHHGLSVLQGEPIRTRGCGLTVKALREPEAMVQWPGHLQRDPDDVPQCSRL